MKNQSLSKKEKIKPPLIQLKEKAQLTIPAKLREFLGVAIGDYFEATVNNNKIILTPKVLFDKTKSVQLSKQGEKMLKESLDDVKRGKIKKFKNIEEFVDDLHK